MERRTTNPPPKGFLPPGGIPMQGDTLGKKRASGPWNKGRPGWIITSAGGAPSHPVRPPSRRDTPAQGPGTTLRQDSQERRGGPTRSADMKRAAPFTTGRLGTDPKEHQRSCRVVDWYLAPHPLTEARGRGWGHPWRPWQFFSRRPSTGVC